MIALDGIKDIPLSCRFPIIVARRVYRQIGEKFYKHLENIENRKNMFLILVN